MIVNNLSDLAEVADIFNVPLTTLTSLVWGDKNDRSLSPYLIGAININQRREAVKTRYKSFMPFRLTKVLFGELPMELLETVPAV